MEAGKDDDVAPQVGDESAAQMGTQCGDVTAATGEQGVTPIPAEGTAAQEGPEEETTIAAPEGKARTDAAQTRQEEAPAGEAAAEDPAALPADVAALLNSPGMVETLQRMVAEATAKAQTREAEKVAALERSRDLAERKVDRQAREHDLALKKAKSRQATLEQERKAAQDEVRRLGSRLHQTRTALQEEREAKGLREQAPASVEKPRTEEPRRSSSIRAQPQHEAHPKEGEVAGGDTPWAQRQRSAPR